MSGFTGKKICIGGNWKCNGTVESVKELCGILNGGDVPSNVEVICFPTYLHVGLAQMLLKQSFNVGVQNVTLKPGFGAMTGEISSEMVKDSGIQWTLTGHSERRDGFGHEGESSDLVGAKTKAALDTGLNVIACVGEKLEEREAGKTLDVVLNQMSSLLKAGVTAEDWSRLVIAYEPVWAIGTGKVATPEQAQEVHAGIRAWVSDNVSPQVASALRIQYGGSVKGASAAGLISMPDIDGFLVGGASLEADFLTILSACDGVEK